MILDLILIILLVIFIAFTIFNIWTSFEHKEIHINNYVDMDYPKLLNELLEHQPSIDFLKKVIDQCVKARMENERTK